MWILWYISIRLCCDGQSPSNKSHYQSGIYFSFRSQDQASVHYFHFNSLFWTMCCWVTCSLAQKNDWSSQSSSIPIHSVYAWSDSYIVLSWLNKPHTCKVFVPNRVHQIQQQMPDCRWFHISSDMNPADCAFRGLWPGELAQHSLYWQGPPFLHQFVEDWTTELPLIPDDLPEVKLVTTLMIQSIGENSELFLRFSSFNRLLRVVAWMNRFVALCWQVRSDNNLISIVM